MFIILNILLLCIDLTFESEDSVLCEVLLFEEFEGDDLKNLEE